MNRLKLFHLYLFTLLCLSLTSAAMAASRPVVLGYSAAWSDAADPIADYDYAALTYIARSFLHPNPNGSIDVPPAYFNPQLQKLAHQHGVKLLMSTGGEAANADNWISLATHPAYLHRALDNFANLLETNHYDGIDIDWEPAPLTSAASTAYGSFLKALRKRFPHIIITTALPASAYWTAHLSWPDVISSVNYVNVMTYDYAGGWGGVAAHGSNLFPPGAYAPTPGYSAAEGMQNLLAAQHLPSKKLLMGLTFWAYRFRANKIGDHFPPSTAGYSDGLTYAQTMDLIRTGHYLSLWDEKAQMPYLQRIGGGSVICYEKPASIRRKCDYAKQMKCAGVMIWNIGADNSGQQALLMNAVAQSFGGKPAVLGRTAVIAQIAQLSHAPGDSNPSTTRSSTAAKAADHLDAGLAALRMRWGITEDQRWQKNKSSAP